MKKLFISLSVVSLLTACGTVIDHPTQHVTVKTPGTTNARCVLENRDMRYVSYTDQKIEIMKSPNDLVVNCKAPGNRERTVVVQRGINGWSVLNVSNGFVPGTAYDYFSRGLFDYPEEIEVSFLHDPIKQYDLPQYMSEDLNTNHQYNKIEHMGPGVPETEKTRYDEPYVLERNEIVYEAPAPVIPEAPTKTYNLDNIHKQYNPAVPYDPTEEDK